MAIIKTPDQRVRVFISSTINELAEERRAARTAIENLRLIPVFFEAGARPHPPRDLYSAYLDQSHIFLGIYWNSYGWVAPGADISGLEDEYRLCSNNKPKLIYVKRSDERQSRLNDLLADIEKSETACYQFFETADELQKLIENDLSVLMSEIFENALSEQNHPVITETKSVSNIREKIIEIPTLNTELFGREKDIEKITELLSKPGVNLVNLLGAGGTGKTTLGIYIGSLLKDNYADGVVFVPLAPISDYKLVGSVIAKLLGLNDSGKQPIEVTVADFLSDKKMLLILDNFEQVIEASKFVSQLLLTCPGLQIIVTSRTSLHIRNERIYNLNTLELPDTLNETQSENLHKYPATALFVDRALQVNPSLDLNEDNTSAIIEICRRMDGLPLAIELAAARTRYFQPAALMSRIEKTLDLVSKGHKDLPERQQTLRGAIEWSYNLLSEDTKRVFRQLGVFKRHWTLESADVVINDGSASIDVEEMTERLLDVSLIKPVLQFYTAEPRFNMLQTVHEYARELLDASEEATEVKIRFANHFKELCKQSEEHLWGRNAEAWLDKLEHEYHNIQESYYIFIHKDQLEDAWQIFAIMCSYWTIRGGFSETMQWMEDGGLNNPDIHNRTDISDETKAWTFTWAGYSKLFLFQFDQGFGLLQEAEKIAEEIGFEKALAFALMFDGCYGAYLYREDAVLKAEKALALCEKINNRLALGMFHVWSTEFYRQQGQPEKIISSLEVAHNIASEDGNIYIHGAVYLLKYTMQISDINQKINWEEIIQNAKQMYSIFPEKGFYGLKSAAKLILSYACLKMNRVEDAIAASIEGLEYSRHAGEMESNIYGSMTATTILYLQDKKEEAFVTWGALNQFIETSGYPLVGASLMQFEDTAKLIEQEASFPLFMQKINDGRKLRLEEAIITSLNVIKQSEL